MPRVSMRRWRMRRRIRRGILHASTATSAVSIYGDEGYAREELVAELGAAFLCADLDLTPEVREDHAAYLACWLEVLQNDKRAIFSAAAHAQRAVDYLRVRQQPGPEPAAPGAIAVLPRDFSGHLVSPVR